jgi:Recombination endonuclease VII
MTIAASRRYYWKNRDLLCAKARAKRDPERASADHRMRKYGLTAGAFAEMLVRQSSRCAICFDPIGPDACVDHSHATGAVRGLLCRVCNLRLVAVENDEWLAAAKGYLGK